VRVPRPFRIAGEHLAIDLPGATACFTTRRGGVSTGPFATLNLGFHSGDDEAAVAANHERLAALTGIAPEHVARGHQAHGTVVRALAAAPDPDAQLAEADGQATSALGVAPLVLVADCLPIAVAGVGAVAMLHGGWRGLADGIVAEGVGAIRALGCAGPLSAAIGPGIGRCCYEVGPEVHARFAHHGPDVRDGAHLDLKLVARRALELAGVETVEDVGLCTSCAGPELFFSHRRDAGRTGRQAGIAWRS